MSRPTPKARRAAALAATALAPTTAAALVGPSEWPAWTWPVAVAAMIGGLGYCLFAIRTGRWSDGEEDAAAPAAPSARMREIAAGAHVRPDIAFSEVYAKLEDACRALDDDRAETALRELREIRPLDDGECLAERVLSAITRDSALMQAAASAGESVALCHATAAEHLSAEGEVLAQMTDGSVLSVGKTVGGRADRAPYVVRRARHHDAGS